MSLCNALFIWLNNNDLRRFKIGRCILALRKKSNKKYDSPHIIIYMKNNIYNAIVT